MLWAAIFPAPAGRNGRSCGICGNGLAEYCGEQPNGVTLEENFGTPQQVAAGYVDDMDTTELLHALRYRRRVTTIVVAGVLTALAVFAVALYMQVHDFHESMDAQLNKEVMVIDK